VQAMQHMLLCFPLAWVVLASTRLRSTLQQGPRADHPCCCAGQLGDGRAISLGEAVNVAGEHWELQLKVGSGWEERTKIVVC
jgi:hypothetical protein